MSRFIICKASAGSGKTYTLVRQFIETAISTPSQLEHRFEHILAITFTNKAASGMKERILSQLHALAIGDAVQLCEEMAGHLSITKEEVRRRCDIVQSAILHHYSELSVCTIDSFVHRLVRTFAHDLRMPMNFDVMIDNQQIIQTTVDELLALAGTEGQETLTKVLCAYTQSRMDSGNSYKIENQITQLTKEIFKEESPHYLEELSKVSLDDYMEIEQWLKEGCRDMESRLTAAARELTEAIRDEGLSVDDFPYKKSGALSLFLRLSERDYSSINAPHKRADEAYTKVLWANKTPNETKSRMERLTPTYRRVYETVKGILDDELAVYNSRRLMLGSLYGLALLSRLNQIKENYYKENEIVHISEFNKRIAEEVVNEPTPFIYERIGSHYYNYMIDEFQDTSRLQWSNFLPLLDEAMTHLFPAGTAPVGTQSLVVGDGKQAIYRFRQGDVRQFVKLPQVESPLHGKSLQGNAETVPLNRNFRTLSNIVEFNNRFFESLIHSHFNNNPDLVKLYIGEQGGEADLIQQPVKSGGYVQVSFDEREALAQRLLDTIRHQVDVKGYNYGDIMILAREGDTLIWIADYITANAGEREVPIVSSESFLLSASHEVLLLQSLLEYIHTPLDRVAATNVVRLYNATVGETAERHIDEWELHDKGFDLEAVFASHSQWGIAFDVDCLRSLSLYDLCETLIRIFGMDSKGCRFLATFMNVVNNFAHKGKADLGEFITYLTDKINHLSSATATDLDAVQLMTIHKAKGLEAKIVLFAMPKKGTPNKNMWVEVREADRDYVKLPVAFVGVQNIQNKSTLFDKAFEEEALLSDMDRVNILYVAMTRAEEKLFVFCEETNTESENPRALLKEFVNADATTRKMDPAMEIYSVGDDFQLPTVNSQFSISPSVRVSSITYPEWEERVSIARQSEALLSPLDEQNRRYGILIHDLLSHIIVADDVDRVVDSYCAENRLSDTVRDDIRGRITRMMESGDNRRYFDGSGKVLCEASIAAGGEVRRPDRIVFGKDETFVVDFKTGAYDEHRHKEYQNQVAEYARLLTEMGFPKVLTVIIYL